MSGPRFVNVPRDAMLAELTAIGEAVASRGGSYEQGRQGGELVFDVVPPGARCMIRVFTSIAFRADEARPCGEDAVRILVCVRMPNGVRSLEAPIKILRTAPNGLNDAARVEAFLRRVRDRTRDAYRLAGRRPSCPLCGRAMARRQGKGEGSTPFFGCIDFPTCRGTAPIE